MDKKEMAEVLKRFVDSLPEDQKQEARTFKTVDELVGFASDAGIALPDELMDAVSGGIHKGGFKPMPAPEPRPITKT